MNHENVEIEIEVEYSEVDEALVDIKNCCHKALLKDIERS
jgi:hypothetical protein